MERVGEGILQVAAMEERKLDAQLKAMENLGKTDRMDFQSNEFIFPTYRRGYI